MSERAIISRSEAKAVGLKHYYVGPCKYGHDSEKRVSDYGCVQCSVEKSRNPEDRNRRKGYMAARQRKYRADHPEIVSAYEAKRDKAERARQRRETRALDPESSREALRRSYQKHKAKRAAEMKIWRIANKAATLAYMRCWKAQRRADPPNGSFTRDDIEIIFEKQDGQCAAHDCQCELDGGFEIDHIEPLANGGSNWPENLQLLCMPCNRSKGTKTMQEWEDWKVQYKRMEA
jgi:5-methylcytosine-specific restriction endonuclease McrA